MKSQSRSQGSASLLIGMVLASFAAAQPVVAQAQQGWVGGQEENLGDLFAPKSAGYAQTFGVDEVEGQLRLYGKVGVVSPNGESEANYGQMLKDEGNTKRASKLTAAGGLAADLRLWGAMREMAAVEVSVEQGWNGMQQGHRQRSNAVASKDEAGYGFELKKVVRLVGFTIRLEKPEAQETKAYGKGKDSYGPKELIPGGIAAQLMVGPVPVLIRANVGVGLELGIAPFVEDRTDGVRAGADLSVGAYGNGWVTGGVGGGCRFASACAGLKAELRVLDVTVGPRLGYDTVEGMIAELRLKLEPAALKLSAIAFIEVRVGWVRIGKSFQYLLFQWSAPAIERVIGG